MNAANHKTCTYKNSLISKTRKLTVLLTKCILKQYPNNDLLKNKDLQCQDDCDKNKYN